MEQHEKTYANNNNGLRPGEYNLLFKLIVIGDCKVGKSDLVTVFAHDEFGVAASPTIGVEFALKTVDIDSKRCKLQIWDATGDARFKTIISSYFRGCDALLVAYDVTNRNSFDHVIQWISQARKLIDDSARNTLIVLIACKADLDPESKEQRVVSREEGEELAGRLGMSFFETSAKNRTGINEMFASVVGDVIAVHRANPPIRHSQVVCCCGHPPGYHEQLHRRAIESICCVQ